MSSGTTSQLEGLLRENDLGWIIDWFAPPEKALEFLARILDAASKESRSRFGSSAPQFTEELLTTEYQQNPHKVRAFLQALGTSRSPQMLLMVWRILQGMRIQQVDMSYRERAEFRVRVQLNSPYEDNPEVYESDDIDDASLLRHFGTMKVDHTPVFDGFYPLHLA